MFTGIIETVGKITSIEASGTNKTFEIESSLTNELKIDQSVAHNGVCLTVIAIEDDRYKVTAIEETLQLSNSKHWQIGDVVNIERAMLPTQRLDGHMVQGHVDTTCIVKNIEDLNGSWKFTFQFDQKDAGMLIKKGSVTIDGTSLTVIDPTRDTFQVAIIPYTYENTVFNTYQIGQEINIEWDIIAKYLARKEELA